MRKNPSNNKEIDFPESFFFGVSTGCERDGITFVMMLFVM